MAYETITQVKRTLYIAECPVCHDRREHTEKVAKEYFCQKDSVWVPFEEVTFVGPQINGR